MNGYSWEPGERQRIAALATLVLGAMLYPLRQHCRPLKQQVDDFPLSHYPMFRTLRPRAVRINYAIGIDADGGRHYLPHAVLGDGGFNQTRHQMNRAVKRDSALEHINFLASRIAKEPAYRHLVRVEIRRGRFDLDDCLLKGRVQVGEDTLLAWAPIRDERAGRPGDVGPAVTKGGTR